VRASGWSLCYLARETGIDRGNLSRFVAGKTGLSIRALEALARELRLRVVQDTE
jgi:transcriptional regulator with XRE-family HTH domain